MDLPNCRLLVFSVIGLIVVRGVLNAALWIYEIYVSQFDIAAVAVKQEPPTTWTHDLLLYLFEIFFRSLDLH